MTDYQWTEQDAQSWHMIAEQAMSELANVLEWAKGQRGTKHCNPYAVPEVKQALQFLGRVNGVSDYLNVDTERLSIR